MRRHLIIEWAPFALLALACGSACSRALDGMPCETRFDCASNELCIDQTCVPEGLPEDGGKPSTDQDAGVADVPPVHMSEDGGMMPPPPGAPDGGFPDPGPTTYAMQLVVVQGLNFPAIDEQVVVTTLLARAVVARGQEASLQAKICDVGFRFESGDLYPVLSRATIDALPPLTLPVRLVQGTGGGLSLDPFNLLIGWSGGPTEALPADPEDVRLVRGSDGVSGARLALLPPGRIKDQSVDTAMRLRVAWSATFAANGDAAGVPVASLELSAVSASFALRKGPVPAALVQAQTMPSGRMVPVGADATDCTQILARRSTLFP